MLTTEWSFLVAVLGAALIALDLAARVIALGLIPENRRPASGMAWLILILFLPLVGFALFWVLGRTDVGRLRRDRQAEALALVRERVAGQEQVALAGDAPSYLPSALSLNQRLGALPAVPAGEVTLFADYDESIKAMASAVRGARHRVHVEFYIVAMDGTTEVLLSALVDARARGVEVRLLLDHLGSRGLSGYRDLLARLDAAGIAWRAMLPLRPWRGELRRPDLRNHRKILVVDGAVAFTGSQNLTEPSYHDEGNRRAGRRWVELTVRAGGRVATSLDAVFATDWYTETGELLTVPPPEGAAAPEPSAGAGAVGVAQVVPSGPGVVAENNLRLFTHLLHGATRRISITSPYFVPDESLLYAVTTAALRGVEVELFVSEEGDQFMVHHAQCSYYGALLDAGVRIWLYEAPLVLHAKHFSVDDDVVVIGSSNMDLRSFALNYEVSLVLASADAVAGVRRVEDAYRARSRELTREEWAARPRRLRYVDNVMRLTASLQ